MTNPTPLRRFQIHLSTAIVMMFVAGALIWANLVGVKDEKLSSYPPAVNLQTEYGWPMIHFISRRWNEGQVDGVIRNENFIIDIGVALSVLLATWFLCEWLIRRRTARKGA